MAFLGPIAAAVAGSAIAGGATYAATKSAADTQSKTAVDTNTTNLNFQKSIIDRGEKSFTDIGLPSAMYWGGNTVRSPNTLVHLGGQNFYEQSGVNSNLPFIGSSPYTQYNHAGQPRTIGNNSTNLATKQGGINSSSPGEPIQFVRGSGQNDRLGLGAGRYSAVPPPASDNTRAVQATVGTRDQVVQSSPHMVNSATTMRGSLTRDAFTSYNPPRGMSFNSSSSASVPENMTGADLKAKFGTGWF